MPNSPELRTRPKDFCLFPRSALPTAMSGNRKWHRSWKTLATVRQTSTGSGISLHLEPPSQFLQTRCIPSFLRTFSGAQRGSQTTVTFQLQQRRKSCIHSPKVYRHGIFGEGPWTGVNSGSFSFFPLFSTFLSWTSSWNENYFFDFRNWPQLWRERMSLASTRAWCRARSITILVTPREGPCCIWQLPQVLRLPSPWPFSPA